MEDLCPIANATACTENEPKRVQDVQTIANNLVSDHHSIVSGVRQTQDESPQQWAEQARDLAHGYAYDGIAENSVPSEEYVAVVQKITTEQLVRGGERLAVLLERCLGDAPEDGTSMWGVMRVITLVALLLSSVMGVWCCGVSVAVMVRRSKEKRAGDMTTNSEVEYGEYHNLIG